MTSRLLRPLTLLSLVAVAALLSGCVAIKAETPAQRDVIGDVQISTTICTNNGPSTPTCPASNYSGSPYGGPRQVTNYLVAYRIPDGVVAPETISASSGDTITYTRDPSYSDALTAVVPPPAGEHWVGYRSDFQPSLTDGEWTLEPRFGLPRASDGGPFQGPFKYRTVVGFIDDESADHDDPVTCADPPTGPSAANANGTQAVCIDSPSASDYPSDQEVATRDLGIVSGGPANVLQNGSATLSFTARFAGTADPAASFQITAKTQAPNVTLTPSATTLTPASDSSTPLTVKADVAPTTPVGTYDVVVTASLPNGQQRQATGKLVVGLGKPVNLALPYVTGTSAAGQTVACQNGDWSSNPTSYAYQWTRDGADIAGATSSTYALTQDDGATLVACRVTASNATGDGQATSGPVRVAQVGGADVRLDGPVKLTKNSDGTYSVDTGITVSCPPRLPKNCGGGNRVTATVATTGSRAAATIQIAHGGFAAPSGGMQKIVLKLTRRGSKLLRQKMELPLVATVVTRNHLLERVTSTKRFTVRLNRRR